MRILNVGIWFWAVAAWGLLTPVSFAQETPVTEVATNDEDKQDSDSAPAIALPHHHCLMLLGLPGDSEHKQSFRRQANTVYEQLKRRGIPKGQITVLTDDPPADSKRIFSARRASIEETVRGLQSTLEPDDVLWVIFIGHADHDGEHARFHIPGPDLRAIDYSDLFDDIACKQQVFWLTMSSSGWFTEPLSKANRIVVTATARDPEPNETEFPTAFGKALGSPISELDRDGDGSVSVLELFAATNQLIEAAYAADDRAPTEHATIDDNADGKGTEWDEILKEQERIAQLGNDAQAKRTTVRIDGELAAKTFVITTNVEVDPETENFEID